MTEETNPQEVDLEEDPEIPAVEKPKRGRPKLPSAEKKVRKAASNKSYYEGIRQKIKQVDKPPPEPSPPKKKRPPSPEPSPPKRKAKAKPRPAKPASPEPSPPKRKARPKPAYEPSSPRSKLVAAYREARLHQQEQKIQRYRSWFE